jgi:hypothetical protein
VGENIIRRDGRAIGNRERREPGGRRRASGKSRMKALLFAAIIGCSGALLAAEDQPSQELLRGHFGLGIQRATWYSWGSSAMADLFTPYASIEAIVGLLPERALYARGIGRFLMLKGFNAYLAGGGGVGEVPNSDSSGSFLVWNVYWSAYVGAEFDMRLFFPDIIPWFINAECGLEARTMSSGSGWYAPFFTFALGTHWRF